MVKASVIGVARSLEELWIVLERLSYVELLERVALGVQVIR